MGKQIETEEIVQAVIVADSFNQRFRPLSLDMPRCLMPLCNVPMIEYTMETLAAANVQEVYVICCAHADKMRAYIEKSKWHASTSPRVQLIVSQEMYSIGDALREIDAKQVLKGDFVLVSGDVVTNADLARALEDHKKRKEMDKNCIMTMLVKRLDPGHRSRSMGEECLYVLDEKKRCLYFSSLELFPKKHHSQIPLENLGNSQEFSLRTDLMDVQVDICTLEIPALFTENFDYQDIRKDFVRGILESDLLGKTIYCQVLENEYACRVKNTLSFDAVTKDVLGRWVYPFVPESRLLSDRECSLVGTNLYKEQKVSLARTALVKGHVLIGENTVIADKAVVINSVIGRNCRIEAGARLENAHLWDGCTVKAQAIVRKSILSHGVVIGSGAKVEEGCLIAMDVAVGQGISIPRGSRLYVKGDSDPKVVGADGRGRLFDDVSDDEDEDEQVDKRNIKLQELAADVGSILREIKDVETESEAEESDSEEEFDDEKEQQHMRQEITATLDRAFTEKHSTDIACLELNTLKMALNITFHDLRAVVIPNLASRIDLQHIFGHWAELIKKFVHSPQDQLDVITILSSHILESPDLVKTFSPILQLLYNADVIEEEAILGWYTDCAKVPELKPLHENLSKFVDWLNEAEEESDSD